MTAERHQLVVAPELNDAAGIHDRNLVGVPDRRQAMGNVVFFNAASIGNVGVVSVLTGLAPLVVAVLALVFLRERMTRSELVAMGITILGAGLLAM